MTDICNSWKGSHISSLIRAWGPPTETTSDGGDGKIYIWAYSGNTGYQIPGKISKSWDGDITYTAPQNITYKKYVQMYVDKNGIIYYWRYKGYL